MYLYTSKSYLLSWPLSLSETFWLPTYYAIKWAEICQSKNYIINLVIRDINKLYLPISNLLKRNEVGSSDKLPYIGTFHLETGRKSLWTGKAGRDDACDSLYACSSIYW